MPQRMSTSFNYVDRRGCFRRPSNHLCATDSGMRISELVDLDVGDVNFEVGS